jgi:hypothetical protein
MKPPTTVPYAMWAEHEFGDEVQDVPERLRAGPVGREGGAKHEWKLRAGQSELVSRSQRRREDERPREPAGQRAPHADRLTFALIARAALISPGG